MKKFVLLLFSLVVMLSAIVPVSASALSVTFEKDIVPTLPIAAGCAVVFAAVIVLVIILARKNRN